MWPAHVPSINGTFVGRRNFLFSKVTVWAIDCPGYKIHSDMIRQMIFYLCRGAVCGKAPSTMSANQSWITWQAPSASVVCKQLGLPYSGAMNFTAAVAAFNSSLYSTYISSPAMAPGTYGGWPFVMSLVGCFGDESALSSCGYYTGTTNDCTGYDAGKLRPLT